MKMVSTLSHRAACFAGLMLGHPLRFRSPSQLTVIRKTPGCGQIVIRVDLNRAALDPRERVLVKPGDFLILQESMGESFTRYVTQVFRQSFFFRFINQTNAQASTNF